MIRLYCATGNAGKLREFRQAAGLAPVEIELLPGYHQHPPCVEDGQRDSHVKFGRRSGEVVDTAIVPRKSEIPVGTLRSILNQAHISPEDWENLG